MSEASEYLYAYVMAICPAAARVPSAINNNRSVNDGMTHEYNKNGMLDNTESNEKKNTVVYMLSLLPMAVMKI